MKRTFCFSLCFLLSLPALAQDEGGATFTFQPIEVKQPKPMGKEMEQALSHYKKKDWYRASISFFTILEDDTGGGDPFRDKAEFLMGKCLYHMKIYQASLNYFDRIIEKGRDHSYYRATLQWLSFISRKLRGDESILERIGKYSQDEFPPKFRNELSYLLGRFFYKKGNLAKARTLLATINENSNYYVQGQFLLGVAAIREEDAKQAAKAFKQILRKAADASASDEDMLRMRELADLNLARIFYSTGQFPLSIKYFDKISRESEFWLESLFEASWAHFRLENYEKALGNLHTLTAPFFEDMYFPESNILKAVILFYNCKYDRTKGEVDRFMQTYKPVVSELDGNLNKYKDPSEFYEFLSSINKSGDAFSARLGQILNAALADRTLKLAHKYIRELMYEIRRIQKAPAYWRESLMARTLMQDLVVQQSLAKHEAGRMAQLRFERVRTELQDLIKQALRIQFETASAEKDLARLMMQSGGAVPKNVRAKEFPDMDSEHMYWSFDGEYWVDELGFYQYMISNECRR